MAKSMMCSFAIVETRATCQLCGFTLTTKQTEPARIHRECDGRICEFELIEDAKIRCVRCNHTTDVDLEGPTVRRCDNPGPGMGDLIESTLSSVGITKDLVARYWGTCGGCGSRQAKINAATPKSVKKFLAWLQGQPEAEHAEEIETEMKKSL